MSKKKILFIGIGFYDYDKLIVDQLKNYGAIVTYFCQEHKWGFFKKLSRFPLFSQFEKFLSDKYLLNTISPIQDYDEIFVIKGDKLSVSHLRTLKKNNLNANFRMYQWDSMKRFEGDRSIFEFFDSIFSFDRLDCIKYGYNFLPLFYRKRTSRKKTYKYDLSFVGWLHFNRLELLTQLRTSLSNCDKKVMFYLYTSSKNWFFLNLIKRIKFVHNHKIIYSKYIHVIEESNAVLDFHHPDQDGLTMRTIEALGSNKKILTTNSDIINYDFFSKNNCFVIDGKTTIDEVVNFLNSPYVEIDETVHAKYCFYQWLNNIFSR